MGDILGQRGWQKKFPSTSSHFALLRSCRHGARLDQWRYFETESGVDGMELLHEMLLSNSELLTDSFKKSVHVTPGFGVSFLSPVASAVPDTCIFERCAAPGARWKCASIDAASAGFLVTAALSTACSTGRNTRPHVTVTLRPPGLVNVCQVTPLRLAEYSIANVPPEALTSR